MKRKIEEKLLQWKNKTKDRKPLILNGARQVGKTYLLREFGEKYYKNTVYVNLEISREVRAYFEENLEPERILRFLEAVAVSFFDSETVSCANKFLELKHRIPTIKSKMLYI